MTKFIISYFYALRQNKNAKETEIFINSEEENRTVGPFEVVVSSVVCKMHQIIAI